MAKKSKNEPTKETSQPSDASHAGSASEPLNITLETLEAGTALHRVHKEEYAADQFNPGVRGNARFSPIKDEKGDAVPTMYAGETVDCALMETIFHDVPHTPGLKTLGKRKLNGQVHSILTVQKDICVASLTSIPLRRMGIRKSDLIETEKDRYPETREVAESIRNQHPDVQGLVWVSKQDDKALAYVLFGDRISKGVITQSSSGADLLEAPTFNQVLDLADRLDVLIIDDD